jgi:CheY-like chemotaxis protein
VTEAECGEKAITICRAHEKGFDLLITDLVLTGMSGGEAADYITRLFPRTRVIYISGYADKGDEPRQKGVPIIQKPFSSVQLLTQVKNALRPGTFSSAM